MMDCVNLDIPHSLTTQILTALKLIPVITLMFESNVYTRIKQIYLEKLSLFINSS